MLQVRKPKRPARLAALPDLTAAGFSADAATGFSGAAERLNASHHPALQWPEFGHLMDTLAAAAAAARGSRRGRAAVDGAAVPGLLLGAGGPVPAAVLDWNDAAAAEAAEQAAIEQQQDDMTAGGSGPDDVTDEECACDSHLMCACILTLHAVLREYSVFRLPYVWHDKHDVCCFCSMLCCSLLCCARALSYFCDYACR
jgi:hypothetical protein